MKNWLWLLAVGAGLYLLTKWQVLKAVAAGTEPSKQVSGSPLLNTAPAPSTALASGTSLYGKNQAGQIVSSGMLLMQNPSGGTAWVFPLDVNSYLQGGWTLVSGGE